MFEHQASRDGRFGWLLCTAHPEQDDILEEIQAELKLELLNSNIREVSKLEIESWLKRFFLDLHWKIHARLRKTDLREKGLSLFFAVFFDSELYFVQFGRLFCVRSTGKKLETLGKTWKNYHVQSMKELSLFGMLEEDIRVRPQRLHLAENETLHILPGQIAAKVLENADSGSLKPLIESFEGTPGALWLILQNLPLAKAGRKRRLNKLQVSSLILLGATVLAVLYMFFGNRIIDVWFHRARKEVSAGPIKEVRKLTENVSRLSAPARQIQMAKDWSLPLPQTPQAPPVFDLRNVYIACGNTLYAWAKDSRQELWQYACEATIANLLTVEDGIALSLANDRSLCLDPRGKKLWQRELITGGSGAVPNPLREITAQLDKRLDRAVMVIARQQGISVVDGLDGELLADLELPEGLAFLSTYDDVDLCFYAVMGNSLQRIKLNISN